MALPVGFPIFANLPAGQQPLSLFDQAFATVFAVGGGNVSAVANLAANGLVLGQDGAHGVKTASGLASDGTSKITLGVAGASVGMVAFANGTSGSITLLPVAGALGASVISIPAITDTIVTKNSVDVLTNKTLTTPQINSPTGLVKADVGLGNVDNTSDVTKFTNTALTGVPTAPTAAGGTISTQIATTAFVESNSTLARVRRETYDFFYGVN